ncbi:MAG: hypothetical protein QNK49_03570 [Porticoccus sp.]
MVVERETKRTTQTSPFRAPQGPGGGCRLWAAAYICWRPVLLNHGITPGGRHHLHHPRSRCYQLGLGSRGCTEIPAASDAVG